MCPQLSLLLGSRHLQQPVETPLQLFLLSSGLAARPSTWRCRHRRQSPRACPLNLGDFRSSRVTCLCCYDGHVTSGYDCRHGTSVVGCHVIASDESASIGHGTASVDCVSCGIGELY